MQHDLSLWVKKILLLIAIILGFYILYILSPIVLVIGTAGFITILINPLVEKWEKYHIHAGITVIITYIIVFLLGSIVIGTLIPIVIDYFTNTATLVINWVNHAQEVYIQEGIAGFHFNAYIEKVIIFVLGANNIEHMLDIIKQNAGNIQSILTNQISSLTSGGISIVSTISGVLTNWILVLITTFLMVLERKTIGNFILEIAPDRVDTYLKNHYRSIQQVCTAWIRATLILSLSIFITTYIGLLLVKWIFGFDTGSTFTLALIGGIMEFVPYIGPLIALIPAAIIGLGISWKAAFVIIILYIIVQQLENNVFVPYVMSKALDLSPFLVFIVMLAGASLGGIAGIILAIPATGVVHVIYKDYRNRHRNSQVGTENEIEKKIVKKGGVKIGMKND